MVLIQLINESNLITLAFFFWLALQRLRCSTDVEDDIEEMRLENRSQIQAGRVSQLK